MEVQRNGKNVLITHEGRTQTLKQWSYEFGVKECTASYRLNQGWAFEEVFSKEKDRRGRPPRGVDINQRGCHYCADFINRKCIHEKCPYHELDNVKTYTEYLKKAKKNGLINILEELK